MTSVLKEEQGAIILGRRTFGKGLIQKKYRFSETKEIFIPIYRFYTDNYDINETGIFPDYEISEKTLDIWIGEKIDEAYCTI